MNKKPTENSLKSPMKIFLCKSAFIVAALGAFAGYAYGKGPPGPVPVEVTNPVEIDNVVDVNVVETGPASGEIVHIATSCPGNGGIFVPIYPVPEGSTLLVTDIIAYTKDDISDMEGASSLDIYANADERSLLTSFLFRPFVTVSHAFQTPIPVDGGSDLECRVNLFQNAVTLTIMGRLVED